jgi:hypothetical protein
MSLPRNCFSFGLLLLAGCATLPEHIDPISGPVATLTIIDKTFQNGNNDHLRITYNQPAPSQLYHSGKDTTVVRKIAATGQSAILHVRWDTGGGRYCQWMTRMNPVDGERYLLQVETFFPKGKLSFVGGPQCRESLENITDPANPVTLRPMPMPN